MTDLLSHPFYLWIAIALTAGILEMILPSFGFIFASAGALVAALASQWFNPNLQVSAFFLTVAVGLIFLRPFLLKRRHSSHKMHSRSDALKGLKGQVTEAIDPNAHTGRVLVNGEDWSARAATPISVGQVIEVSGSDGIVLLVKEV